MKKLFTTILITILVFGGVFCFAPVSIAEAYEQENVVQATPVKMTAKIDSELRLWATVDGPAYATLIKGESIDVLAFYPDDENYIWAQVVHDEENTQYKYGYVNMEDLLFASGKKFKLEKCMQVNGNTVNIREDTSIQADICGLLYKGDVVSVEKYVPTSDGRIWAYCCDVQDEFLGWVSVRYLTPEN